MKVARYLMVGSLCAVLVSGWILWNTHLLMPNMGRISALLAAIGILSLLIVLVGISVGTLIKSRDGEGIGSIVALFGLVIIAMPAVLTITNWWIGPTIRSLLGLSSILPNDNLFVAGGWIAHTAAVLVILLVVSALLSIKPVITSIGTLPSRWSSASKDTRKVDEDASRLMSIDEAFK